MKLSKNSISMGLVRTAVAAFLLSSASACSSLTTMEHITAFSDDKMASLLDTRLDQYRKALYWGSFDQVGHFINARNRSNILNELMEQSRDEKIVELTVGPTDFSENGDEAEVELQTRFFKKYASNYVERRKEKQIWKYHRFSGGWKLHSTESLGPSVVDSSSFADRSRASFSPTAASQ